MHVPSIPTCSHSSNQLFALTEQDINTLFLPCYMHFAFSYMYCRNDVMLVYCVGLERFFINKSVVILYPCCTDGTTLSVQQTALEPVEPRRISNCNVTYQATPHKDKCLCILFLIDSVPLGVK